MLSVCKLRPKRIVFFSFCALMFAMVRKNVVLYFTVFGQWRKVCRKKNILAFCSDFSAGAAAVIILCASFRMALP